MYRDVVLHRSQIRGSIHVIIEPQAGVPFNRAKGDLILIHIEFIFGVGRNLNDQFTRALALYLESSSEMNKQTRRVGDVFAEMGMPHPGLVKFRWHDEGFLELGESRSQAEDEGALTLG
jgi:hypothetical protein